VLDTALCFGWIDGQRKPGDEHFFLQRCTPRGPRSNWSQINRDKALGLAFLYRLRDVKTPRRRAERIATYIEMLGERRKFYP
jgi:uncharacterized protein YdeI (YjbR/CyaY-like superfamily)